MNKHCINEILLQVRQVGLRLANKTILRNIDFEVANISRSGVSQGQVIALVGRSGIGKTQLFRILAGLQRPDSGEVLLADGQPVRAGDMGVIFQNYYLFEWRTVFQSLLLAARKNRALRGQEKPAIEGLAEQFGIPEELHRYPHQLSGGQRQRACILQQLLKGSDFLLLDEPFSGLDVCVLDKVTQLLREVSLSDERKTLFLVSHDIGTSISLADTVFVLGREPGIDGATVKARLDLIDRGLAWQPEVHELPAFRETVREIKSLL